MKQKWSSLMLPSQYKLYRDCSFSILQWSTRCRLWLHVRTNYLSIIYKSSVRHLALSSSKVRHYNGLCSYVWWNAVRPQYKLYTTNTLIQLGKQPIFSTFSLVSLLPAQGYPVPILNTTLNRIDPNPPNTFFGSFC